MKTLWRVVLAALLLEGIIPRVLGQDETPPTCVSASSSVSLDTIIVTFSKPLEPSSATDIFNYAVPGNTIRWATLDPSGTVVRLGVDVPLTPGELYGIEVVGLQDLVGNELTPCTLTFQAFVVSCGFALQQRYLGIPGQTVADLTGLPQFPRSPDEQS
jgi:hypothetical protein